MILYLSVHLLLEDFLMINIQPSTYHVKAILTITPRGINFMENIDHEDIQCVIPDTYYYHHRAVRSRAPTPE